MPMISLNSNIHVVLSPYIATIQSPELLDKVTRTVATEMLGLLRARIHQEGKAADGSDIGQYSTKSMYVSIKQNVGRSFGSPLGKPNEKGKRSSTFKSGKKEGQKHTSRYFEQGYKEYKTQIGRNVLGKVNLSLSGQLDSQLTLIHTQAGWGLGWADTEKYLRAKALQDKKYKKKIWALSAEEAAQAVTTAQNILGNAFS